MNTPNFTHCFKQPVRSMETWIVICAKCGWHKYQTFDSSLKPRAYKESIADPNWEDDKLNDEFYNHKCEGECEQWSKLTNTSSNQTSSKQ